MIGRNSRKWNKIGVTPYCQNVVTFVHFTTMNVNRGFNFAEKSDVEISQHWKRKLIVLKQVDHFSGIIWTRSGPGSSVGTATDYELDGPGSNSGGDEIFRPSRPALGTTKPPVKCVPGVSRG